MKNSFIFVSTIALAVFLVYSGNVLAGIETSFLYNLSDFNGRIPINKANFFVDQQRNEIYVVDQGEGIVRVFNDKGMEIFQFGDDGDLGLVLDVAVRQDGNILVLSNAKPKPSLVFCNFRGEPISKLELKNLPPDFSNFVPSHMVYQRERLYFLDAGSGKILVTDADGRVQNSYDPLALMGIPEEKRDVNQISGFSADRQGNMLFTIPVLFRAFKLTPEGKLTGFGTPGSAPGKFNIAAGIVSDDRGYYYVADRLKSVIVVFDENFQFVKEFGYRGSRPENLIAPMDLALDLKGRLYVSQVANKGVSVFNITYTPQQAETQ